LSRDEVDPTNADAAVDWYHEIEAGTGRLCDLTEALQQYDAVLETPFFLLELLSLDNLTGLYYDSGVISYTLGHHDDAIRRWSEGVRNCPEEVLLHFNLAATLLEVGRPDRAAQESIELLRRKPGHEDAWHNLAVSLQSLGHGSAAAAAMRHESSCLEPGGELSAWLRQVSREEEWQWNVQQQQDGT